MKVQILMSDGVRAVLAARGVSEETVGRHILDRILPPTVHTRLRPAAIPSMPRGVKEIALAGDDTQRVVDAYAAELDRLGPSGIDRTAASYAPSVIVREAWGRGVSRAMSVRYLSANEREIPLSAGGIAYTARVSRCNGVYTLHVLPRAM